MDFSEVKKEVKDINFDMLRMDKDDYFEAVVVKEELEKLQERLKKFFIEPISPSKDRLSFQMQVAVKDFGSIRNEQTLYFWNEGQDTIFAMLWPWQDGSHTTLKMGKR